MKFIFVILVFIYPKFRIFLQIANLNNVCFKQIVYHRERILETSTLSCNEEEEEITKPPTR
jgi:hypothetical protein